MTQWAAGAPLWIGGAAGPLVKGLTHCSTWERRSDFNGTCAKGTDAAA